jgi:hypothetical protein
MAEIKCKQHFPIVVQTAIGHDPETQVISMMIAMKTLCMTCGMVQQVPSLDDMDAQVEEAVIVDEIPDENKVKVS